MVTQEPKINVIVLGMQYSGSSAIEDFLRLRSDACAPLGRTEWAVITNARGLLWAESAIYEDFHPAKAAASLNELERFLRASAGPWRSWSLSPGFGMAQACRSYQREVDAFIRDITSFTYPYRYQYFALRAATPRARIGRRISGQIAAKMLWPLRGDTQRMPVTREEFRRRVKTFLEAIIKGGCNYRQECELRVLPQAGTFWRPESALKLFSNSFVVRVNRDPRDQFAELKVKKGLIDVSDFIAWRRAVESMDHALTCQSGRVVDVSFERFVGEFESQSRTLCEDLQISCDVSNKFDITPSKKNVGKYRDSLSAREVLSIEAALPTLMPND